MAKNKQPVGRIFGESIFSFLYLVFAYISSIYLLVLNRGRVSILLLGVATLTLAVGDSFHLVPRIASAFKRDSKSIAFFSNLGLIVSSITMTLYYVVIYFALYELLPSKSINIYITVAICALALIRCVLCLCKGNRWFEGGNSRWGLIRNLPFFAIGIIVMVLYMASISADIKLFFIGLLILLSFLFYAPVALYVKKKPILGMLMIPKTLCYIGITAIFITFV